VARVDVEINNAAMEAVLLAARRDALEDGGADLIDACMEESPVGKTGHLRRSHKLGERDPEARYIDVENDAEYALAVHDGAKAHWIRNAFGRGEPVWHPGNKADPWMRRAIDRKSVG
jgi:hypothetical protein